ncbi:hypothetical protein [Anaerobranca gottschalkii]|uniref:hypothetical protein n=1 Tax=Anaerobranca gottschalkii TaxID=108328 RepID=UPI0015A55C70|nr:hypothetical protein [Anaerobranca gottschalkii]
MFNIIPILGYLDDLVLIPMGIAIAIKLIPTHIIEECKKEAESKLISDIPEAKVACVIIVTLWLLILGLVGCKLLARQNN